MFRTRSSGPRMPRALKVPAIRFLGEQVGPSEQLLQGKLIEHLRGNVEIRAAYLSRVAYPDRPEVGVALCVSLRSGSKEALVKQVGATFASIFYEREHLDIIFLNDFQEEELARL